MNSNGGIQNVNNFILERRIDAITTIQNSC